MKNLLIGVSAVLMLACFCGGVFGQETAAGQSSKRTPKYTNDGTAGCLSCHSGERMQLVATSPHGNTKNASTPYSKNGCESCHGPGSFHVSRAHGGRGFGHVIKFGSGKDGADRSPAAAQVGACTSCHQKGDKNASGMLWAGSAHDRSGLTCANCHSMHSKKLSVTDRDQQAAGCYACHAEQKEKHRRFSNAGIVFDELKCWTCHDVHQLKVGSVQ
jgi:DmsE family decaheme c-type cytochrome